MADKQSITGIVAGLGGGLLFILFWAVLNLGLPLGLLSGVGGFIAFFLIGKGLEKEDKVAGVNSNRAREVIMQARSKRDQIQLLAQALAKGDVRSCLERLAVLTDKIVEDVKKDPKDASAAGKFLDYYGDTVIKIATLHRDLSSHGLSSSTIAESQQRVQGHLHTLIKAFEVQLVKLQEDNLLDLDTELKVLERTMAMEGLGEMIEQEQARTIDFELLQKNRVESPWKN